VPIMNYFRSKGYKFYSYIYHTDQSYELGTFQEVPNPEKGSFFGYDILFVPKTMQHLVTRDGK